MHHHARLALALSFLAFAALAAAPALALDGSAVVTGVGAVSFVGAAETNWVHNADNGAHDLLLKFTGEGSFTLPGPTQARVLAVGGGGGGAGVCSASAAMVSPYGGGGGGGAGGVVEITNVFSAATYAVEVGAGGAGGASASAHSGGLYSGRSGGDTTLSTNGVAVVTAKGGGGGGGETVGGDGGSGGGGSQYRASSTSGQTRVGGSGIDGQGHAGGPGDADLYGGGGGGAGSTGAPASTRNTVGGDGRPSDITGETVYYGGGGGGGFSDKSFTGSHAPVSGGRGGGGNGGYGLNVERTDATFYGGGGGGCGAVQSRATTPGGSGYAGVVYVRIAEQTNTTPPVHPFVVRKLYDGEHSVPTDLSTVELAIYSEAAASSDAHGSCLTYVIEGDGIDCTDNTDDEGERFKLNGIYDIEQENHYMATFGDTGWTRITAKLKEGGAIRVTGVFGPYNPEYAAEAPNGMDRRKTLSTAGLLQGQTFYVIERSTPFGNGYEPTGYVYEGDDDAADPRVDATGMTATQKLSQDIADETDPIPDDQPSYTPATVPAGALFLKGVVTGSATTVFVVNRIDENKVSFIDVDVTDWDAPYDGEGHGAAVTMLSTFSDDDGEPLYDWWRASYALGDAEGPTNDWSAGTPLFTNVCEQTVWMAFDADYWRSTTTSAVVRIRPAALAITARDQTYVYNGRPQGEGDPVYTDPADIAAKVDVEGLAAGDALASIVLTGQRTEPGTEWIVPSGAVVTNATGDVTSNYDIGYTNGTLTIGAPAPPSVSNVVARQRWPWNGLVDVDYEVGGTTTGLVTRISFAEQGGAGRSWVATNFLAGAEPSAEPGFHRATWDTAADGATNVVAAKVTATVELVREPPVSDGNVWSLVGDFNSWGGDVDMTLTDGKWVSPVTKITAGGFKIRFNHDWTENVGGVMEDLGIPFAAISGGDNISIEEGNDYVVTYDPDDQTILVEFIGWGVVGTINSWGGSADLAMKEENGMFVRKNVTLAADDEIKVRYRNSWDVNYGGRTDVGFAVEAISGGDNLKPGAGTYDIWLDAGKKALFVMKAGEAPEYWGVVGNINSWGGTPDAVMYHDAEGYFVAKGIALAADDEIKIRKNSDWTDNRGASDAAPDTALDAVAGGDNIKVAAGTYDVYYQSASEKIYVMTAGKTPADVQ